MAFPLQDTEIRRHKPFSPRIGLGNDDEPTPFARYARANSITNAGAGGGHYVGTFVDWDYLRLSKDLFLSNLSPEERRLLEAGKLKSRPASNTPLSLKGIDIPLEQQHRFKIKK